MDWGEVTLAPNLDKVTAILENGVKFDGGKNRIDLVPPDFLWALAELLTVGAKKYSDRNWEKGMNWSRPLAALYRHLLKWQMGEDNDPETGANHLTAVAWNAMVLFCYQKRGIGTDDSGRLKL